MPATHTAAAALDTAPFLLIPFAKTWPLPRIALERALYYQDVRFSGYGRVYGDTKVKGIPDFPKYARVRLFDEVTGLLLREQWSNPTTGAWEFLNVNVARRYTVIAYDPDKSYRAVAADNLQPEPMA